MSVFVTLMTSIQNHFFSKRIVERGGTRWRNWLRHCATTLKDAGSIPDGVTKIFH